MVKQLKSAVIKDQFGGWTLSDEGSITGSAVVHLSERVAVV
jgi:hypothetical protein